jgi:DNA-binding XRE family transcriptional regulator
MGKAKLITDKILYREIALRLKYIRQFLGMSIKKMAQELDIAPTDIINIEKGKISETTFYPILSELGKNYGLNINMILYGKGLIFIDKGPKIKDAFYQKHKDLFLH